MNVGSPIRGEDDVVSSTTFPSNSVSPPPTKKLTAKEKKVALKEKNRQAVLRHRLNKSLPEPKVIRPRKNYRQLLQSSEESKNVGTSPTKQSAFTSGLRTSSRTSSKITEPKHYKTITGSAEDNIRQCSDPSDAFTTFNSRILQIWTSTNALRGEDFPVYRPSPVKITDDDSEILVHVPPAVDNLRNQLNKTPENRNELDKTKITYYNKNWEFWILNQCSLAVGQYFEIIGVSQESGQNHLISLQKVMDGTIGIVSFFVDQVSRPVTGPPLPLPKVIRQPGVSNKFPEFQSLDTISKSLFRRTLNASDPPFKTVMGQLNSATFGEYHNFILRVDDMASLIPGTEITSPIMDACGGIISDLIMSGINTRKFHFISHYQFVNALRPYEDELGQETRESITSQLANHPDVNLLVVPLVPGFHYVIAVIDVTSLKIKIYDPLHDGGNFIGGDGCEYQELQEELLNLVNLLAYITRKPSKNWIPNDLKWERFPAPSALGVQKGVVDCGIYCLLFLELFGHLISPTDMTVQSHKRRVKELFANATRHHFDKARKRYFFLIQKNLQRLGTLNALPIVLTTSSSVPFSHQPSRSVGLSDANTITEFSHPVDMNEEGTILVITKGSQSSPEISIPVNSFIVESTEMEIDRNATGSSDSGSISSSHRLFFAMDQSEILGNPFSPESVTPPPPITTNKNVTRVNQSEDLLLNKGSSSSHYDVKKNRRFQKEPKHVPLSTVNPTTTTTTKRGLKNTAVLTTNLSPASKQALQKFGIDPLVKVGLRRLTNKDLKIPVKSKSVDQIKQQSKESNMFLATSNRRDASHNGESSSISISQIKKMSAREKQQEAGKIISNIVISIKFTDLENLLNSNKRLSALIVEAIGSCIANRGMMMGGCLEFTLIKSGDVLSMLNDSVHKPITNSPSSLFTLIYTVILTGRIVVPFDYLSSHWILIILEFNDSVISVYDPQKGANSALNDDYLISLMEKLGYCVSRVILEARQVTEKGVPLNKTNEKIWKINETYLNSPQIPMQYKNVKDKTKSDTTSDGLFILSFLEEHIRSRDFDVVACKQAGSNRQDFRLKGADKIRRRFFQEILELFARSD